MDLQIKIEIQGTLPLLVPPETEVRIQREGEFAWVPARAVFPGDRVVLPVQQPNTVENPVLPFAAPQMPLTDDRAYVLGWYIAKGRSENGKLRIDVKSCGSAQRAELTRTARYTFGWAALNDVAEEIIFGHPYRVEPFAAWFGAEVSSRKIPDFIMGMYLPSTIAALLRGYFDAASCVVSSGKNQGTRIVMLHNERLALQIQRLATAVYAFVTICKIQRKGVTATSERISLNLPAGDATKIFTFDRPVAKARRNIKLHRSATKEDAAFLLKVKRVTQVPDTGTGKAYLHQNIALRG